jgi:hypothetical protein
LFTRFVNFCARPLLGWLGYRKTIVQSLIPQSHYYSERHSLADLADVHHGFLTSSGWLESVNANLSYFKGEHKPWLTFPSINFLETMDLSGSNILEFGGGASTIYFSKRASTLRTFEFDSDWSEVLRTAMQDLDNVQIIEPAMESGLLQAWAQSENVNPNCEYFTDLEFESDPFVVSIRQILSEADIVVIDGGPRNLSMVAASKFTKSSAMVIVDNSDTDALEQGIKALRKEGFIEIPMRGLGALNPYEWTTSFFIRDLNSISLIT